MMTDSQLQAPPTGGVFDSPNLEPIEGGDVLYPAASAKPPGAEGEGGDVTLRAASLRAGLAAKWQARRALAEQAGANGSG